MTSKRLDSTRSSAMRTRPARVACNRTVLVVIALLMSAPVPTAAAPSGGLGAARRGATRRSTGKRKKSGRRRRRRTGRTRVKQEPRSTLRGILGVGPTGGPKKRVQFGKNQELAFRKDAPPKKVGEDARRQIKAERRKAGRFRAIRGKRTAGDSSKVTASMSRSSVESRDWQKFSPEQRNLKKLRNLKRSTKPTSNGSGERFGYKTAGPATADRSKTASAGNLAAGTAVLKAKLEWKQRWKASRDLKKTQRPPPPPPKGAPPPLPDGPPPPPRRS